MTDIKGLDELKYSSSEILNRLEVLQVENDKSMKRLDNVQEDALNLKTSIEINLKKLSEEA